MTPPVNSDSIEDMAETEKMTDFEELKAHVTDLRERFFNERIAWRGEEVAYENARLKGMEYAVEFLEKKASKGGAVTVTNAALRFQYRVEQMIHRITYKDGYRLICEVDKKDPQGRLYLQVECERPDVFTKEMGVGRGGKAYLSEHMTGSEIARLAYGLFAAYEEHECREFFRVDGVAVFGPHIALEALLVAGKELDFRD